MSQAKKNVNNYLKERRQFIPGASPQGILAEKK